MKKAQNSSKQKAVQQKPFKSGTSSIRFNLSQKNLACFKSQNSIASFKEKPKLPLLQIKKIPASGFRKNAYTSREKSRSIMYLETFNEQVVFMNYDNLEMYVDNSTNHKANLSLGKSPNKQCQRDLSPSEVNQIVSSCVKVLTQETDNTSNNPSRPINYTLPNMTTFAQQQSNLKDYQRYYQEPYYQPKNKGVRNKRAVTNEQSRAFIIQFDSIESDGRTTIMIKNIPNKYTQDMLYDEISINHKDKFDFFYLPIDKNSDCNFGFAFVNFSHTSYIREFYNEFHNRRWKQYKSPKICQLYYARYQGTQELAEHFRYTKILTKQKKVRPIFNNDDCHIKEIKEIISSQLENKKSKQLGIN